ncbi:hypothetical protein EVAR_51876_1 [Eumeta japonica]|uniref:Uncharacterized protein n=1 Tax=Eumeta variegata TaxID=151549 RepID=A0A4C1YM96_EUMVA|nr:hypothetical protein EVAR_51876_1 [Eumeta japonica]
MPTSRRRQYVEPSSAIVVAEFLIIDIGSPRSALARRGDFVIRAHRSAVKSRMDRERVACVCGSGGRVDIALHTNFDLCRFLLFWSPPCAVHLMRLYNSATMEYPTEFSGRRSGSDFRPPRTLVIISGQLSWHNEYCRMRVFVAQVALAMSRRCLCATISSRSTVCVKDLDGP